ncbi:MAG: WYL domain-containing protein, partial [Deltaproteobacteria bacterium]|nr:WYL domain-containing protein [Deltaproteobacteria bacterium]
MRARRSPNSDGSMEITFRVAGLDEIRRLILSFSPEAAVLEPEKLFEIALFYSES